MDTLHETLLMTSPTQADSVSKRLGTAIRQAASDPHPEKHFREGAATMPELPRVPGEPPGENSESNLLRTVMAAAKATGQAEGKAVTKFQLSVMTTIIGLLWGATMFLGNGAWSDLKSRVDKVESKQQDMSVSQSAAEARNTETVRRMEKAEAKQDIIIDKLNELTQEVKSLKPR